MLYRREYIVLEYVWCCACGTKVTVLVSSRLFVSCSRIDDKYSGAPEFSGPLPTF